MEVPLFKLHHSICDFVPCDMNGSGKAPIHRIKNQILFGVISCRSCVKGDLSEFWFNIYPTVLSTKRAVTKIGTGTGTWDARTRGRRDVGLGDAGTRGRGDAGTWDAGTWERWDART